MDYLSSELKIEFKSLAIIGSVYSFIISFFFLNYFRNNKFSNCFIFIINVLHMTLIFLMPILVYMTITTEKSLFYIKESDKCFQMIKYINMVNQALNKLIYPLMVVYYRSGFLTLKNKFTNITFSDVFYELYAYIFIIIIAIIYFPLKEELMDIYHNDELLYFLNYLNILDLIYTYFEIGYSCGSLLRYFYAVFTRKEEYQHFILGKLSIYEKEIKTEFRHRFSKFVTLANLYSHDIRKYKLNEVNTFISYVDQNKYYDRERYRNKNFEKVNNIKENDLEKILSKSYGLSKSLFTKIRRIETLRQHQINKIKKKEKKRCCCFGYIYKCCISGVFKKIRFFIFAAICIAILVSEGFYFQKNKDQLMDVIKNKTNEYYFSTNEIPSYVSFAENNITNNTTDTAVVKQLGSLLLMYPLYMVVIFATCGIYIIPVFYSITRRAFISGDFIYEKKSSDTLEMIISVRKLSSKIFSCLYLSVLFYTTYILNDTFPRNSKGEYNQFLKFFEVPYSVYVLAVRYVYIIAVIILTRLFEKINCKCCVIYLSDECYFEPRPCEPCVQICIEGKRNQYIETGKKEADRILGNSAGTIGSSEQEFLSNYSDSSDYSQY